MVHPVMNAFVSVKNEDFMVRTLNSQIGMGKASLASEMSIYLHDFHYSFMISPGTPQKLLWHAPSSLPI